DCQAIIDKAMAKKRAERYATATAMAEALAAVARSKTTAPFPPMTKVTPSSETVTDAARERQWAEQQRSIQEMTRRVTSAAPAPDFPVARRLIWLSAALVVAMGCGLAGGGLLLPFILSSSTATPPAPVVIAAATATIAPISPTPTPTMASTLP